jgi:hypothetical protein
MKNVTLSAEANLLEQARLIARSRNKTLNAAFREWLEQYTAHDGAAQDYSALMESFRHVTSGGHFTRNEMNER